MLPQRNASQDTEMGGVPRRFPTTRWSMIVRARDPAGPTYREAVDELCRRYWKPVYASLRAGRTLSNEAAKDATQEFFAMLLEGPTLHRYAQDRGSFRAYLKGVLHLFFLKKHRNDSTQKRGGGRKPLSLDGGQETDLKDHVAHPGLAPDEVFEREWARTLLDHGIEELQHELAQSNREIYFEVFERYHFHAESATYSEVGKQLRIQESDVSNYLLYCRKRLRAILVEQIRDYVAGEEEVSAELAKAFSALTGRSL